jgi:3'-5' exoribonuclease
MPRLPVVRELASDTAGWGFFLCTEKEVRSGRGGDFIAFTLQDATGQVTARLLDQVERYREEFDAGEFVRAQGRLQTFNGRLQFVVESIRRVLADQDRAAGFDEGKLLPSAPRPIDDMWAELQEVVAGISDSRLRQLLHEIVTVHEARLRTWPAARTVHHAYRGGLLEHSLKMAATGRLLAAAYGADADLVVTGALLHDIGKLQELTYDTATTYSREGNLVGHVALGMLMVRDACRAIPGFPPALETKVLHLIASHHGEKAHGSPIEPMTIDAFILATVDNLDATINQVRRALAEAAGDGEFTAYHSRLGRVFWKGEAGQ